MKKLLLVLLSCYCISLNGQDHRMIINQHLTHLEEPNDSIQFNACIKLATHYNFIEGAQDSVAFFAQKGLDLAEAKNKDHWKISALYYLGLYHHNYNKELELAIEYFSRAKELLVKVGDVKRLSTVYNAIGMTHSSLGDYESAMNNYREVFRIAEKEIDYATMSNALANTAVVYAMMNDLPKAIETYKEALDVIENDDSIDKHYSQFHTMLNLVDLLIDLDSLSQVEHYIGELENLKDSIHYQTYLERFTVAKLNLYETLKDSTRLTQLSLEAYNDIKKNTYTHNEIYNTLSYYYALHQFKNGKREEVRNIMHDLINREQLNELNFTSHKYHFIQDLAKKIGDYPTAFAYLEKYNEVADSVSNDQKSKRVEELLAKYELEKKEREIKEAQLEQVNLRRKNAWLIAGVMGLLGIGSFIYLLIQRTRQKEKEEMYQIEQKMLSLQMNPHFIFNAISSIQNYLFDEGDRRIAIEHLATFSQLMRQILDNSREKFISLESEIAFIEKYLKMQQLRFDDKFKYEIIVDPQIDVEVVSVPPLLTQPFIENAIEHGQLFNVQNGLVSVKIKMDGGNLLIAIEDNGIGITESQELKAFSENDQKKSYAISITKERLQLLTKLVKKKFDLDILSSGRNKGTVVNINLPAVYL